ncbi:unnamed protein product [Strongylus vulgaris]|uniref:Uncharacterized protein n=1 Tax=Strongylus vulgaris TaxID=40348 RepID=A0A3P7IRQ3_STRVU|nr:unnamed protein product [Strongylus vulgaris]
MARGSIDLYALNVYIWNHVLLQCPPYDGVPCRKLTPYQGKPHAALFVFLYTSPSLSAIRTVWMASAAPAFFTNPHCLDGNSIIARSRVSSTLSKIFSVGDQPDWPIR